MSHILELQGLEGDDAKIGSTLSLLLCGSSFSTFWC